MEPLERLTRRQVDALRAVGAEAVGATGAALSAVARRLAVSPPVALEHLGALERARLVVRHRGKSRLTPLGDACLREYLRHHRVAEQLFASLGFDARETCAAAREIDLALGHGTVERLCRAEGHPPACPHGEAIPPCAAPARGPAGR